MEAALRRMALPKRDRQGQRVDGKRSSLIVEGPDIACRFLLRNLTDLLEAAAEDSGRRVVEEEEPAVGIGQECGQREVRDQVARLDQQERLVLDGHISPMPCGRERESRTPRR